MVECVVVGAHAALGVRALCKRIFHCVPLLRSKDREFDPLPQIKGPARGQWLSGPRNLDRCVKKGLGGIFQDARQRVPLAGSLGVL